MAPKLNRGVSTGAAIAWQDSENQNQFHYMPSRVELKLGETLQSFAVTYWGIGKKYLVQESSGKISSRVGAVIAGTASLDISGNQRDTLTAAIKQVYPGVGTPALLPVFLQT